MIKLTRHIMAVILCLFAGYGMAQQEVNILITSGADRAIPIAVVPFAWSGEAVLPEDMAEIIAQDFTYSGLFRTLPKDSMLSHPAQATEVSFSDWKLVEVDYVLIGRITEDRGRLEVQYDLFSVSNQRKVYGGKVAGTASQLRDMAHFISDRTFEHLTGIKGAFSTRLLFVGAESLSSGDTRYTLYRSDYDGARPVALLQSPEPLLSPRFSPDGRSIAYVSFEKKRPRIFVQEIATGRREQITDFTGLNSAPAWSPDGRRLAMVLSKDGNPEIYVMDLATRDLQRLTEDPAIDTEPYWGKDGKTLYFTSDRTGKPQIYRLDTGTGKTERVTFEGNYNANPKLSADEKTLVMVHRQGGYKNFQIAVQDLTKNTKVRVLSNTGLDDSPTVAPNGTMLIYASRQEGKGVLMLVSINGRIRVPLQTVEADLREAAWSPFLK